jgi:hypothetical protein
LHPWQEPTTVRRFLRELTLRTGPQQGAGEPFPARTTCPAQASRLSGDACLRRAFPCLGRRTTLLMHRERAAGVHGGETGKGSPRTRQAKRLPHLLTTRQARRKERIRACGHTSNPILSVQVRYYSGVQKQAVVPVSDTREKAYSLHLVGS